MSELKTGFYYIALKANVPIIPVAFDFGNKEVRFCQPLQPSGDLITDLQLLNQHFVGVKGKIPEYGYRAIES